MAETTLYDILEVSPTAGLDEIKAAYRRLSTQVHPDRGGSGALFRLVCEAYEILSDDDLRAEYDRSGVNSGGSPRRARSADGGSGLDNDVKTLAERTLVLNQSLLQLEAAAISDHDRLDHSRLDSTCGHGGSARVLCPGSLRFLRLPRRRMGPVCNS